MTNTYLTRLLSFSKDGEIDLKLLGSALAPESEVFEVRSGKFVQCFKTPKFRYACSCFKMVSLGP